MFQSKLHSSMEIIITSSLLSNWISVILTSFFFLFLFVIKTLVKARLCPDPRLPPGSLGWPLIGETLQFMRTDGADQRDIFIRERMEKYDSRVFKTSLLGYTFFVFCGTRANKFLFTNENTLVTIWWPLSVKKLLKSNFSNRPGDEGKRMRRLISTFFTPDALKTYIHRMDLITRQHIASSWQRKKEVKVYPTVKVYTFELACLLFASIEDPIQISKLAKEFDVFVKGVISLPMYIPGTRFYASMKAADAIRKQLQVIIRERRAALEQKTASPTQQDDLLSHLLVTADASGRFMSESEIIDNTLMLLYAGHDTSKSAITLVMRYLAEYPHLYENVFKEQIDIGNSKVEGDEQYLLSWEDIQKMRYSWNVVSEVMRLSPPIPGGFREALVDFTYAGYHIPKGSKLYWGTSSTHKNPSIFPEAERLEASRFEGRGPPPYSYVPFGGGPRMCLGHEYARLEILVFLHNIVRTFKWELSIPDEKFGYDPMLIPSQGLPIRLQPHYSLNTP